MCLPFSDTFSGCCLSTYYHDVKKRANTRMINSLMHIRECSEEGRAPRARERRRLKEKSRNCVHAFLWLETLSCKHFFFFLCYPSLSPLRFLASMPLNDIVFICLKSGGSKKCNAHYEQREREERILQLLQSKFHFLRRFFSSPEYN